MKTLSHNLLKNYVRRFPIDKGKRRVMSMLWKPLSFGRNQRMAHLSQANIRMNCDLSKEIQRQIYFFGGYEKELCQLWIEIARESSIIFDVGANVGLYSLLAARKNPGASVHAFEPTPDLVKTVQTNLKLNRLQNVTINEVAVGQERGQAFLHLCAGSNDGNEGMNFVSQEEQDNFDVATEVIALDDYCQENGIAKIDLMKMDIEGGEYGALLGSKTLLQSQSIGCIFLELAEWAANRSGNSTADIKRILLENGYQIYTFEAGKLMPLKDESGSQNDNVIAFAKPPKALLKRIG